MGDENLETKTTEQTENLDEEPKHLKEAKETVKRMEEQNKRLEENLKRLERYSVENLLDGKSIAGQTKQESNADYAKRVMKNGK